MKLKVVKLGQGITSFVALVKMPKENYCENHKLGADVELPDPIGHALMAAYPGVYEVLSYGSEAKARAPKDKMATAAIDFEAK